MKKNHKPLHRTEYDMCDIILSNTVSNNDYTGLIPASPQKEDDMKNYEEIKSFYPATAKDIS